MRFFDQADDERLNRLVEIGALNRPTFETAVGDKTVSLLEALLQHRVLIPETLWIAAGVRMGWGHLRSTGVTAAFIRSLTTSAHGVGQYLDSAALPFNRNKFGQMLVACLPGWTQSNLAGDKFERDPIRCIVSLSDYAALREAYLKAV